MDKGDAQLQQWLLLHAAVVGTAVNDPSWREQVPLHMQISLVSGGTRVCVRERWWGVLVVVCCRSLGYDGRVFPSEDLTVTVMCHL